MNKKRFVISIFLIAFSCPCICCRYTMVLMHQFTYLLYVYEEDMAFAAVDFSPDGRYLIVDTLNLNARVYDLETGEKAWDIHQSEGGFLSLYGPVYSPDGNYIVNSEDAVVVIRDSFTGAETLTIKAVPEIKITEGKYMTLESVHSAIYSPDGSKILSTTTTDKVQIWESSSGDLVFEISTSPCDWPCFARYSPDGERIVSGRADGTVWVWDAQNGDELLEISTSDEKIRDSFFSPNGKQIITLTEDEVGIWDASTGEIITILQHRYIRGFLSIDQSPDGKYLAVLNDKGTLIVWDINTQSVVRYSVRLLVHSAINGLANDVAFSPDGKWIAVSGEEELAVIQADY